MVFGREAEGIFDVEIAGGDGRGADGTGDSAKGGVVVVSSDTIASLEVNQFRDVLVPVKGVEKLVIAGVCNHKEWARGHGFGWIPDEEVYLRVVVSKAMEFSHAKPLRQFCL